jgi:hypothetical protein
VLQAGIVTLLPQVITAAAGAVTAKVLVHVFGPSQLVVYVQVTSTVPPHIDGGVAPALLVNDPLHPPLAVAEVLKAAHAASTCACVLQAGIVTLLPQVITAGAGAVTAKVLIHVFGASQLVVYVQVTSTVPPHIDGGVAPALLVKEPLHPPLAVAEVLKAAHAASTCACVLQAGIVTLLPQVITAGVGVPTVKVLEHVWVG